MEKPKSKTALPAATRSRASAKRARTRYSQAEIREIFRRFSIQRPESKGELEHVNAFTLLVPKRTYTLSVVAITAKGMSRPASAAVTIPAASAPSAASLVAATGP